MIYKLQILDSRNFTYTQADKQFIHIIHNIVFPQSETSFLGNQPFCMQKVTSRTEPEYMNMPPPSPSINVLAPASPVVQDLRLQEVDQRLEAINKKEFIEEE